MGFFSGAKDRLVEGMAMAMLNRSALQAYGRITALKLDSQGKRIEATIELKGEREPVQIHVREYALAEENGRWYLVPKQVVTSREWLTALAADFLVGRRFALPPEAGGMIAQCL